MGKKKRQKRKELSVGIAEASTSPKGGDTEQQQTQPTRKRGRPRKVVMETVSEEIKVEAIEEPVASAAKQGSTESLTKKEEEQEGCTGITKEDIQISKGEPSRNRARRKSKPRKST